MADAGDLKSLGRMAVLVRVRSPAPGTAADCSESTAVLYVKTQTFCAAAGLLKISTAAGKRKMGKDWANQPRMLKR